MKLKHDKLLSNFAFNFDLRPSTEGATLTNATGVITDGPEVGRCSFRYPVVASS